MRIEITARLDDGKILKKIIQKKSMGEYKKTLALFVQQGYKPVHLMTNDSRELDKYKNINNNPEETREAREKLKAKLLDSVKKLDIWIQS